MTDVKAEVRALLDRLPDDCTYADVQRGIAVLMWPKQGDGSLKPPERLAPEGRCRCAGSIRSPPLSINARSMMFLSSRTLPGKEYLTRTSRAAGLKRAVFKPISPANVCKKWSANNAKMSSIAPQPRSCRRNCKTSSRAPMRLQELHWPRQLANLRWKLKSLKGHTTANIRLNQVNRIKKVVIES